MAGLTQYVTSTSTLIDGVELNGGTVDVNGTADAIILDADGDTTISSPTDDQIDFEIAGADDFTMTANTFNILSNSKIQGSGSCIYPSFPAGRLQSLSGAGAITITEYLTKWTSTGVNAGTLADGVTIGQLKKIIMIVDAGDATLTPTNLDAGTTITFADAGDFVVLMWNGTDWVLIDSGNLVDGVSAPVLA
jgi:hypothetical protein